MKARSTNHIYPFFSALMVIRETYFPIQTLQNAPEGKGKKGECFEWKKHYTSLSKFYFILFFNILQYPQAMYLKLSVSEVLVLE